MRPFHIFKVFYEKLRESFNLNFNWLQKKCRRYTTAQTSLTNNDSTRTEQQETQMLIEKWW